MVPPRVGIDGLGCACTGEFQSEASRNLIIRAEALVESGSSSITISRRRRGRVETLDDAEK